MSSIARFDTWQAADGTNVARYNAGQLEVWDGSTWGPAGTDPSSFEFLVIAGGGSGGGNAGGGGGAGGYRCGLQNEVSGGPSATESPLTFNSGASFTVTVGAGGAAVGSGSRGNNGVDSTLATITSTGGGGGGHGSDDTSNGLGRNGGSGGGGGWPATPPGTKAGGTGTSGQGTNGGYGGHVSGQYADGGAGGSAHYVGQEYANTGIQRGIGIPGPYSLVTGSAVARSGGGGGSNAGYWNTGAVNTGNGGRGGPFGGSSYAGGSGVVILRYAQSVTLTIGAGLTASTSVVGDKKVTVFTSGTDTVTVA